jgi:hypothetical protein
MQSFFNKLDNTFSIVTYPGFAWLIRRVLEWMVVFIDSFFYSYT